jgi:hypothetical protein
VGDVLERAVLQEPGEEDVAGLDEREVLLVLGTGLRQQPGGLEVEQGRGDDEELGGLGQVPAGLALAGGTDEGDELVGDAREGDLGDVELVLADQPEEEVEGAGEVLPGG